MDLFNFRKCFEYCEIYRFDRAFIQEFDKLGRAMMNGEKVSAVPPLNGTHDIYDNLKVYQMMKNYMDSTPFLTSFGDVNIQPRDSYKRGEMVQVEFWAGSPHNDLVIHCRFKRSSQFSGRKNLISLLKDLKEVRGK